jgi:hypothetical protein
MNRETSPHRGLLLLSILAVLLGPRALAAQAFNVDLGATEGTPSNFFGAAAQQQGTWNTLRLGTTNALFDVSGHVTAVSAKVTAQTDVGNAFDCTGDIHALLADNIFSSVNTAFQGKYSVELTGLENGDYTVFLYAPRNSNVPTGVLTVNGVVRDEITGDFCSLLDGTTQTTAAVAVTNGKLSIAGAAKPPASIAGLAGVQVVPPSATAPCVADADTACLQNGRLAVEVDWQTSNASGRAAVMSFEGKRAATNESAFFFFFGATNFEIGVKVLDGCGINDRFWVYIGGLTDQGYTVRVRDTQTGRKKTYTNAVGHVSSTVTDVGALACS